jgi:protoporphyrinogen oxidase
LNPSTGSATPPRELSTGICVLGAGPAGLAAALELTRGGRSDVVVLDRNATPGGLARTERFDGHRFDVGPHRFFTQNREVDALWHEMLGEDFRPVQRLTRIFYDQRFYLYPVSALDALPKLGPVAATRALASYLWAAVARDVDRAETFEQWVAAKFGTRLYESFFKTYTEKVWGIPCSRIGADWAAQRIKGLDLLGVAKNAFGVALGTRPKTLVDEFDYPVLGAGQMYERMAERAAAAGVTFVFDAEVRRVERRDDRIVAVEALTADGPLRVAADRFVSTLPLTRLLEMLAPAPPADVLAACRALYYRDHITVNLVAERADLFPDQWIYVHDPQVRMARLANYRNFSPRMAATAGVSPISVEYFVFRDDEVWAMDDADLIAMAGDEVVRMGLVPRGALGAGWVVRETDSYPTYYLGYAEPYARVRRAIDGLANLQPAGRGGLYKYNNMDHSLYSGLLAARNLLADPPGRYDVWRINIDAEYHEAAERR